MDRSIEKILYKFEKGYPDVDNPNDMKILVEHLESIYTKSESHEELQQQFSEVLEGIEGVLKRASESIEDVSVVDLESLQEISDIIRKKLGIPLPEETVQECLRNYIQNKGADSLRELLYNELEKL